MSEKVCKVLRIQEFQEIVTIRVMRNTAKITILVWVVCCFLAWTVLQRSMVFYFSNVAAAEIAADWRYS